MGTRFTALVGSVLLLAIVLPASEAEATPASAGSPVEPAVVAPTPSPGFIPAASHPCLSGKRRSLEGLAMQFQGSSVPLAGPPDPPTDYDAEHYDIQLAVDFDLESITGEVSITARSLVPKLTRLIVDLSSAMNVASITREGVSLSFEHAGDRLFIDLDRPFATDELLDVLISYSGHPVPGGLMGFSFSMHQGNPIASTVSQPWGAPTWWPCKETPEDKATARIGLTAPASMVAASNGVLTAVEDHGETKTWWWETTYPIATYLVCAAITNYERFTDVYVPEEGGTMALEYFVYPEHYEAAVATWDIVVDQLMYYRTVFGEYPFIDEKYGMAEIAFGGAMEHQTLTSIGPCCIEAEMVIAHELAHQWWGDKVTCATWHDLWLNEGFARYAEALLWGELNPDGGYQQYMEWLDWVEPGGFPGSVYQYDLSDPGNLFSPTVYDKGAWVLHMLRWVLGEEDFFAGLLAWGEAYAYGSGTTEDLEAVLETQSGTTLDWFFDQWVYGEKRPEYEYAWAPDTPEEGQALVQIAQVQDNAPAFKMPIPLVIATPTGFEHFTVWDSLRMQTFILDVQAPQSDLAFDPDNWLLDYHRETVVSVDGDVALDSPRPPRAGIERVYPVPFRSAVTITLGAPTVPGFDSRPVTLAVYDVAGRLVRTLMREDSVTGTRAVLWDGRTNTGYQAPSGSYFVRLSGLGVREVQRIVRAR